MVNTIASKTPRIAMMIAKTFLPPSLAFVTAPPAAFFTSASVGTIVTATIPIFVVIFAALRLKQPVSAQQALGLLAAGYAVFVVADGVASRDEANKALALPETRKRLAELGFVTKGGSAKELTDFINGQRARFGPLIKSAGIKAD